MLFNYTEEFRITLSIVQVSSGSIKLFGYRSFEKLTDLQNTNHYLKGDRLIVSILITNNNDTAGKLKVISIFVSS